MTDAIELFDDLVRDLERRAESFRRRGLLGCAEIVEVDKRLVERSVLKLLRKLKERAELEQGF